MQLCLERCWHPVTCSKLKSLAVLGLWCIFYLAVDPILIASDIISGIQTIISREIDPLTPTTITIGKIYGGQRSILFKQVRSGLAHAMEIPEFIRNRIEEIVKGITYVVRAKYEMTYHYVMPPVYNDPQLTSMVQHILARFIRDPNG